MFQNCVGLSHWSGKQETTEVKWSYFCLSHYYSLSVESFETLSIKSQEFATKQCLKTTRLYSFYLWPEHALSPYFDLKH